MTGFGLVPRMLIRGMAGTSSAASAAPARRSRRRSRRDRPTASPVPGRGPLDAQTIMHIAIVQHFSSVDINDSKTLMDKGEFSPNLIGGKGTKLYLNCTGEIMEQLSVSFGFNMQFRLLMEVVQGSLSRCVYILS
jgi:hypothetical protein